MIKITSIEQLNLLINDFKKRGGNLFSNWYPNPPLHESWIDKGVLLVNIENSILILLHKKETHIEFFFFTYILDNIKDYAKKLSNYFHKPVVIENVYRNDSLLKMPLPHVTLKRMVRKGSTIDIIKDKPIKFEKIKASHQDIRELQSIFSNKFNPLTERIPSYQELESLIEAKGVSLIKDNGKITGFIIYEIKGKSCHLRYWWIDENYRNKGIGSCLIADMFKEAQNTSLQYLWVFENNEDAIQKYNHYGYSFDGMNDDIYIIN